MGWETRRGSRYYYRKERGEDGRVRSVYCGSGERGEQAEREDIKRRIIAKVSLMPSVSTTEPIRPPEPVLREQTEHRPELSSSIHFPRAIGSFVTMYPSRPNAKPRSRNALQQWRELGKRRR